MNALLDLYAHEPAVVLSAAGGLVSAVIVLLVSFGLPITMDQRAAINGLVVVVITVVAGVLIRGQVTPTASLPPVLPPHG